MSLLLACGEAVWRKLQNPLPNALDPSSPGALQRWASAGTLPRRALRRAILSCNLPSKHCLFSSLNLRYNCDFPSSATSLCVSSSCWGQEASSGRSCLSYDFMQAHRPPEVHLEYFMTKLRIL